MGFIPEAPPNVTLAPGPQHALCSYQLTLSESAARTRAPAPRLCCCAGIGWCAAADLDGMSSHYQLFLEDPYPTKSIPTSSLTELQVRRHAV